MTHYIFTSRKYLHVDRNTSNINMFILHLRLGMENERSTNEIGDGLTRNNLWILPLWRKRILPWEKWAVEKSAVRLVRFSYSSSAGITAFCSMTESCIQHPNEKLSGPWSLQLIRKRIETHYTYPPTYSLKGIQGYTDYQPHRTTSNKETNSMTHLSLLLTSGFKILKKYY